MNTKKVFFALLSISLAGCELGRDNELALEDPIYLDEVRAVLNSELLTPPRKLKSVYFYQFDNDHFLGRSDYYYNDQGKEILLVGLKAAKDTFSVALYEYDTFGNQITETGYDKVNNMYK
jgi:hypothetical protein